MHSSNTDHLDADGSMLRVIINNATTMELELGGETTTLGIILINKLINYKVGVVHCNILVLVMGRSVSSSEASHVRVCDPPVRRRTVPPPDDDDDATHVAASSPGAGRASPSVARSLPAAAAAHAPAPAPACVRVHGCQSILTSSCFVSACMNIHAHCYTLFPSKIMQFLFFRAK
jgi:hypothetical protein